MMLNAIARPSGEGGVLDDLERGRQKGELVGTTRFSSGLNDATARPSLRAWSARTTIAVPPPVACAG